MLRGQIRNRFLAIEKKGIPIRISIGKNEIAGSKIQVHRREGSKQSSVEQAEITPYIQNMLREITDSLKRKAKDRFEKRMHYSNGIDDATHLLNSGKVLAYPLCFEEACIIKAQSNINRGEVLGLKSGDVHNPCVICSKPSPHTAYISRRI